MKPQTVKFDSFWSLFVGNTIEFFSQIYNFCRQLQKPSNEKNSHLKLCLTTKKSNNKHPYKIKKYHKKKGIFLFNISKFFL